VSNQAFVVEKISLIRHITSSKTCNVKKLPMSKTLKKIDEGNEGTKKMSVSEKSKE